MWVARDRGAGGSRTLVAGLPSRHSAAELQPLGREAFVEPEGVAPSSPACRTGILLLNHGSASVVGVTGFAPAASRSRTARSTTELHPETHIAEREGIEPSTRSSRATRLAAALLVHPDPLQRARSPALGHIVTSCRRLVSRRGGRGSRTPKTPSRVLTRFSGPAPSPHRLAPPGDAHLVPPHPARAAGIHGASSVDPGPRRPAAARSGRARPAGRSRRQ